MISILPPSSFKLYLNDKRLVIKVRPGWMAHLDGGWGGTHIWNSPTAIAMYGSHVQRVLIEYFPHLNDRIIIYTIY